MNIVGVLTVLYLVFAPCYLQDPDNNQPQSNDPNHITYWPYSMPNAESKNNGPYPKRVQVPCRRRNLPLGQISEETWVPSFTSTIVKPYVNNDHLKPESLKLDNVIPKNNETPMPSKAKEEPVMKHSDETIKCFQIIPPSNEHHHHGSQITSKEDNDSTFSRRKIQHVNDNTEEPAKPNVENRLAKLCSDLKTNSDHEQDFNGARRSLNKQDELSTLTGNFNKYTSENLNEKQQAKKPSDTVKKSNQLFKSTSGVTSNKAQHNSITDEESNEEKDFKYGNNEYVLSEPTIGEGISDIAQSRMMLMENSRICYACNSASDPTCWAPSRKTTVKYCRKEHDSCITKTYINRSNMNSKTVIRDCAKSCDDIKIPGLEPKYKTCSVCHFDLCNGAFSINSHNTMFIVFIISCIIYKFQTS